jgi:hypothetical protein
MEDVEPMTEFVQTSEKIERVIEVAADNQDLSDILEFGTPEAKLEVLRKFDLTFEELVEMHKKLDSVLHQSSIKFWWW